MLVRQYPQPPTHHPPPKNEPVSHLDFNQHLALTKKNGELRMKYRTFPAATCGPKMASTIPGKACIRYLFDCANIEQNAATINMIVDRPTDSPVVMRQILPTASVLKSTMVKIADILSAHPNPRTSGRSDLRGAQALKSCNRRAPGVHQGAAVSPFAWSPP